VKNWEGNQPKMITRILGGFYHPFIHMGFGLEFRDRVVLAEGYEMSFPRKVYHESRLKC
jgi:hypothetical protein